MNIITWLSLILQVLVGFNLILPLLFLLIWLTFKSDRKQNSIPSTELDFAVIVTAYQHTLMLNNVVNSILSLNYKNYHIYIIADNCDEVRIDYQGSMITVLRPETILANNIKSHNYAISNFVRNHDCLTIIDSDNLVHTEYLREVNESFFMGFNAVQGLRAPKNLNNSIACLDAARDIYYHFYDGKILFEIGSSATLSGSGMAFRTKLYEIFLESVNVEGAGFDKVLQAWLVLKNERICFNKNAIVFDEKTSKPDQLVQQRSRWINSWFKYARYGLSILGSGFRTFNKHQILFGIVLLRPPLFIFLALSMLCMTLNLLFGHYIISLLWLTSLILFVISFYISLIFSQADARILSALKSIPKFMYYQFVSLYMAKRANKLSVSTKHYVSESEK